MIFVDASAFVAILSGETDGPKLHLKIAETDIVFTSALATYEATLAISRSKRISLADATTELSAFCQAHGIETRPITENIGARALDAFERFGKGRHPAGLNMGDCFAYASAAEAGARLLCKGADFPQTDALLG